jgi:hypothetical protein
MASDKPSSARAEIDIDDFRVEEADDTPAALVQVVIEAPGGHDAAALAPSPDGGPASSDETD